MRSAIGAYYETHYKGASPPLDCLILDLLPANLLQGVNLVLVMGCSMGEYGGDAGQGPAETGSIPDILVNHLGAQCAIGVGENGVNRDQLELWLNGDSEDYFMRLISGIGCKGPITPVDVNTAYSDCVDVPGDGLMESCKAGNCGTLPTP